MKKNALLSLLLILWVMLFNTFFSFRVEKLMTPWVTTTVPQYGANSVGTVIPLDCQFWDEVGAPVLYQVYDGMVWESGNCVRLLDPEQYKIKDSDISVKEFVPIVRYSTKQPRAGEQVNIIEGRERQDDTWLAIYSNQTFQMKEFGEDISIEAKNNSAALLSIKETEQPFLEKSAMAQIFEPEVFSIENTMGIGPQVSIYSLLETRQFFSQLPVLAVLIAIVFAFLFLWLSSCILAKDLFRNKRSLILNAIIAFILTVAVPICIHSLNFPSSLLPQNNIAEVEFYANKYSEIFGSLRAFAADGNQIAQQVIEQSEQMIVLSFGIIMLGIVLAFGIMLVEIRLHRRMS